jgi:hypothetical protein
VAAFACLSERAVVHVVLAVTSIAIHGQSNFGNIFGNVAGVAIQTSVRPRQRVTRLRVVIEAPPRPTIWIVAERTIRAQATLMMLVAVTGRTIQRRPLEQQRAMAFLARHDGVAPD